MPTQAGLEPAPSGYYMMIKGSIKYTLNKCAIGLLTNYTVSIFTCRNKIRYSVFSGLSYVGVNCFYGFRGVVEFDWHDVNTVEILADLLKGLV